MVDKKALAAATGAAVGFAAGRWVDFMLVGGLVAIAAGAVGFAGYETLHGPGSPQVNGMQYLAIFAQPNSRAAPPTSGLDMNPVGALPKSAPEPTAGYTLAGAQPRFAWLREGNRIFAVAPGDDVPRLGVVASIEPREGRWALIGAKGETLVVGAPVESAPSEGGHFNKRMIFRDAR